MFTGFKQERAYLERTVAAFRRLLNLDMIDPQPHGGVGNFRLPQTALSGQHPVVGEQAGFQGILWGFGWPLGLDLANKRNIVLNCLLAAAGKGRKPQGSSGSLS